MNVCTGAEQVESKLWMMTGEDASLGTRKIQYDDFAYCLEAHGNSDSSTCRSHGRVVAEA